MKLLIVEDHKNWCEVMGRNLVAIAERTVMESESSEPALTWDAAPSLVAADIMLAGSHWDAVILDLNLKNLGPDETLQWLSEQKCSTPFIVVSGLVQDCPYRQRSFDSGASDYFWKPEILSDWSAFFRSIYHAVMRQRRHERTTAAA